MMNTVKNQFETYFEKLESSQEQKAAFNNFLALGFPTAKNEDWKYSSLKKLDEINFNFALKGEATQLKLPFENLEAYKICFVNGCFNAENSNLSDEIKIFTLYQAQVEIPEIIQEFYGKSLTQTDGMASLNSAMSKEGCVIFVAENKVFEKPILIHNVTDSALNQPFVNLHNLVVVSKNAQVKVIETFTSKGSKPSAMNISTEIFLDENAIADYYKIQNESDAAYHVGTTQVLQKNKSVFYAATVSINGGFIRNNLNVVLAGQHCESHLFGLYIPNGNQHIDNHTIVDHTMPNCESNELYKGVLSGKSTGVFNGKIFVRQDAQKTNAFQNCRNVLNSDDATMNSKPQLEIWADDVKCSHGTTTGKLNDEAIFYMQSRGIAKSEAIKLQLVAFAADVVSQIKIEEVREELEGLLHEKLD